MKTIEQIISPFVSEQFPDFYKSEGPLFIEFVKEYYKWMEQQNQSLGISRSLFSLRDIDQTNSEFVNHFTQKYFNGIPARLETDPRLLVKHATDVHHIKGTAAGVQTVMRAFFNEESTVSFPKKDIFRVSDGKWVKPRYIELSIEPRVVEYIGRQITGTTSGARAFVESVVKRRIGSKYIYVAYLSSLEGDFETGEQVVPVDDTQTEGAPHVVGSLTAMDVISGGADFAVGDILTVSGTGKQGKARVAEVANETGKVIFKLEDGGWGYSLDGTQILLSDRVYGLQAENNYIDISYVNASPNNSNIAVNATLYYYYANGQLASTGTVSSIENTYNSTSGVIRVLATPLTPLVSGETVTIATSSKWTTTPTNTSIQIADVTIAGYARLETVTQKLANVAYTGAQPNNALFVPGAYVQSYYANGVVSARARIVQSDQTNTTAGYLVVRPTTTNTLVTSGTIFHLMPNNIVSAPTVNAVASSYVDRTANGLFVGGNTTAIGLYSITQPFIQTTYAPLVGTETNTHVIINSTSTGSGATFRLASLQNTENVLLSPDFLSSNNTANTLFHTIKLTGSNSGASLQYGTPQLLSTGDYANGGFGFVKFPSSNLDSVLLDCLRFDSTIIGTIAGIAGLVTGEDYNADPFVTLLQRDVAGYNKRDYRMHITPTSGAFVPGELIQQSISTPALDIAVTNFTGTYANGSAALTFLDGEYVYQSNASANVAAHGIVQESGIISGSGMVKLVQVGGTFVANTVYPIKGLTTRSTSNATATQVTTVATTARAIVKSSPPPTSTDLWLKRINLATTFSEGGTIIGRTSGAVATVGPFEEDGNTMPIGINAVVSANVQVANSVVSVLDVYDTGFGYVENEQVILEKDNHPYAVTAQVSLGRSGFGGGYFESTDGFLDADKKLHDNNYYQDFSYEVSTRIPFDQYIDVLKEVTHVAGTKAFGRVVTISAANVEMTAINNITIT
jgi:hypothetical protein